jgi:16S rRNA (guanine527-N7)-methyltransferase
MDRPREPLPSRVEGLPELPAEALAELDHGLSVLGLTDLPGDSRRILVDHLRLLAAWNEAVNLTAIRDPLAAVRLHVLDSLTAVGLLRAHGLDALVDLGSGGGFPGIPLAVAVPARRALLVDSVAKKTRFLAVAVDGLGLAGRVEAFTGRAEELAADRRHRDRWPAVVARAVGSLAEVAEIGLPLVAPGGLLITWKRGDLGPEFSAAEAVLAALGGGPTSVVPTDPELGLDGHVLVVTTKVGSTPPGYPRDPATRRRGR